MADAEFDDFEGSFGAPFRPARVQRLVNLAGAATSVALVLGLAVWGYKVAVRDVTGIPVVRALEGPMRVAPIEPGGDVAAHQGLSVNAVAAVGTALPPPDRLVLAPRPVELSLEDAPGLTGQAPLVEAPTPVVTDAAPLIAATEPEPGETTPQADATALALAEALAEGVEPFSEIPEPLTEASAPPEIIAPLAAEAEEVAEEAEAAPSEPAPPGAVTRSPRPQARPATEGRPVMLAELSAPAVTEVDAATLASGTRLVQLGAFDDAEAARAEWNKLGTQFAGLLEGKSRVVQSAQSGGRTFFRLRAHGFEDEADARRFCSALLAENAACIPVAVR